MSPRTAHENSSCGDPTKHFIISVTELRLTSLCKRWPVGSCWESAAERGREIRASFRGCRAVITALVAETLSVSPLARLSQSQSLTLAALVTVVFGTLALARLRTAPSFAGMTAGMLLMLWRGEAWKAAYLDLEQSRRTLLPLSQPTLQSLSSVAFRCQSQSTFRPDQPSLHVAENPSPQLAAGQFRLLEEQSEPRKRKTYRHGLELWGTHPKNTRDTPVAFHLTSSPASLSLALCRYTSAKTLINPGVAPRDSISSVDNYQIELTATPRYFI